jgi:hypothetical protein
MGRRFWPLGISDPPKLQIQLQIIYSINTAVDIKNAIVHKTPAKGAGSENARPIPVMGSPTEKRHVEAGRSCSL